MADDVLSIAELEHCVLRAPMSRPRSLASKWVLPRAEYAFALADADPRLNFALNVGSAANPPAVPVYEPKAVDAQLDAAAAYFVGRHSAAAPRPGIRGIYRLPAPRLHRRERHRTLSGSYGAI